MYFLQYIIMMKKLIFIIITAIAVACNYTPATKETGKYIMNGDTIIIPEKSVLKEKLKIETVKSEPYQFKLTTTGIVKAIPNKYAQIASPFAGRIIRSFVKLGQRVAIDSPIFEISSPSFFEAGKAYYQSKQEMLLAEKNLKRQQDLLNHGVGIQKEVEEADVNYELTKRDLENCVARLKVYHVNPDDLVLGQPLIVRSPIEGEIIDDKIVIGQYLKEDAEPIAIVAELSKVWVVGQLKEKDINAIHELDEVGVKISGMPDLTIKGKVYHISEMLDEATRSVQVFIECNNKERNLKPGMYVTTQFSEAINQTILISTSSVLQLEGSSFVFVQLAGNRYLKRSIETSGTDKDRVILKSGLKTNEEIVSQGGFYLLEAI
jgi:membrane fusion protein, heavy metal efflux system